MARRIWFLVPALLAASVGCVSVTAPPTAPISSTPLVVATATPVVPTDTAAPSATPAPTPTEPTTQATGTSEPQPTDSPTPTPLPTEEPTLAPGETPKPTPLDVSNLLTASLNVISMTDEPVSASVDLYSDGDKVGTVAKLDIEPDGALIQAVPAATYVVSITVGAAAPVMCELTIADGNEIDFAVVGSTILVTRADVPPAAPEDIFLETSPLCA
jgi:hypothetical protein